MKYLYIHGANATGTSFNYIREHLGGADIVLEYSSANGFKSNLESMIAQISDEKDLFVIAHSLGGVYALYLADQLTNIQSAITLATPYGGSSIAGFASIMLPHSRLLRDIVPTSEVIRGAANIEITKPWCQVVTTQGNVPWLRSPNDGVITQDSMRAKSNMMDIVEFDTNHYEVILDTRTVELIKSFW